MTPTAQAETDRPPGPGECWCCGTTEPEARLVHLGNHPEVVVCTRCAHFLHTRAWAKDDHAKTGPGVRTRNAFRQVRRSAMAKGWHRNRFVGPPLRWLGKRLP